MTSEISPLQWQQLPDEPNEWYYKFEKYFLMLGPTRTLHRSYKAFCEIEGNEEEDSQNRPHSTWIEACEKYNWRQRADAFDAKLFTEDGAVELARQRLRKSTLSAVDTLIDALNNPRLAVSAAKEILDRGGIPATQSHILKTQPFTADEMAAATKEIEEWEKQTALNG